MNPEKLVQLHDEYRKKVLNLQASENYLSYRVRRALASDMATRYSMVFDKEVHGARVHNAYGGTKFQEEILNYASRKAAEIFGFRYVNVKPISGHIAAMTVLVTLTKRGDKIMAIPPEIGGYDGYSQPYMPEMFGLKYVPLNLKDLRYVDVEQIRKERPNLVILGASYILFPYNLSEVLDAAEDVEARVVYDASHVMGLLPSGFQENLHRCIAVYGSIHKTFPGPQGGVIFTDDEEIGERIDSNLTWRTQDNFHTNRVAALSLALQEFASVAETYGIKVRNNSRSLARSIHELGLKVRFAPEFTSSHQVLLEEDALTVFGVEPPEMSRILEKNGIIVDAVGRIGTAELTWKGYDEKDMQLIGDLIIRALSGEDVRPMVDELVKKWDGKTMGEKAMAQ